MRTLKASLLGSAIGTGAWMLGLTHIMWPAHPQWAVFFLTLGATIVLMYILPEPQKQKVVQPIGGSTRQENRK